MENFSIVLRKHPFWTATITTLLTFTFYYTIQFTTSMNIWTFLIRQFIVAGVTLFIIYLVAGSSEIKFSTKGAAYGFRYTWWILLIATLPSITQYIKYFTSPDKNFFSDVILGFILTALISVGVGLFEEGLFRGLILNACLTKMGDSKKGVTWAIIISSLLFGFAHLVPSIIAGNFTTVASYVGGIGKLLQTASIGLILAVVYIRTRNLWVVALYHGYNDFVGFWPYYMLDHGLPSSTDYVTTQSGLSAEQLAQNPVLANISPYITSIGYFLLVIVYLPAIIFALKQIKFIELPDWGFFKENWTPRIVKRVKSK